MLVFQLLARLRAACDRGITQRRPSPLEGVRGLTHPQVRRWCAELLDHGADDRCIEPLVALMDDLVAHSLSCQRCKVIPLDIQAHVTPCTIELALHDPCVRVRS